MPSAAPSVAVESHAKASNAEERAKQVSPVPKKSVAILVPREDPKKMGRPTNKTGDLESDYVKISPKISRDLKEQMDRALLDLRKDSRLGILTLEDLVSNAVQEYLKKHQVVRP